MNAYRHADWLRFRGEVIKLHGARCARCGYARTDGAVLQAHHKRYIPGRLPWDYDHVDCEALCKGCHAEEHGKIMPRSGWTWLGTDDLGDIADNCELCGQDIRYVYAIEHPGWGSMAVGTVCCDQLTGTTDASDYHDRYLKKVDMRKRFVGSKRWQSLSDGGVQISQRDIKVAVRRCGEKYVIYMNDVRGKLEHETLLDAKIRAFDVIDSGSAADFFVKRRRRDTERVLGITLR